MTNILIKLFHVLWVFLWTPAVVLAAAIAVTGSNDSPLNVPVALAIATLFFSSLAGVTTLSMRVLTELKAGTGTLSHAWLYCASHMLGSWSAGAFTFLIAMQQQSSVWVLLAAVLLASFIGAKLLERAADHYLRIAPKG